MMGVDGEKRCLNIGVRKGLEVRGDGLGLVGRVGVGGIILEVSERSLL